MNGASHTFLPLGGQWQPSWLAQRLWYMLIGWGAIGLAYGSADWLQGSGVVLPAMLLDRLLPFSTHAVWPYLSMFILVPLAYLRCHQTRLRPLTTSMQVCALVAWFCFLLYPTALPYAPPHDTSDASGWLLTLLIWVDTPQNCLPSLHAALTLLSVRALLESGRPWRNALLIAWGITIGLSIIVLRRHQSLDLFAGLALGMAAAWLCGVGRPHGNTSETRL